MQPREEHHHGVDQPVHRVLADTATEQGPIRQRELQVVGDQDRIEWSTVDVNPISNHADGLHRGCVQAREVTQQPILVDGQMLEHFLHRVNLGTDPHETNDVAGYAAGQSDEHVFGPFGERGLPREAQEPDIRLRGGEPGHRLIFSNHSTRPPTQCVGGRSYFSAGWWSGGWWWGCVWLVPAGLVR